jgi:5-formyltetrahydrofolate cyclo-ligase
LLEAKRRLREQMRERLRQVPAAVRASAGEAVARRVLASPEYATARRVVAYVALPDELPTDALLEALAASSRELWLPRMRDDDHLEFATVRDFAALRRGRLGILEPPPEAAVASLERGDLVLVPGLAFDRRGARLGRGRGCYDRSLQGGSDRPTALGLAFAFQIVESVPRAAHDRGVDAIATEAGLERVVGERAARELAPGSG